MSPLPDDIPAQGPIAVDPAGDGRDFSVTILRVLAPGSDCYVAHGSPQGGLVGKILQICLEPGNRIRYQVAWFDGPTRRCEWLEAFEVHPSDLQPARLVGFAVRN